MNTITINNAIVRFVAEVSNKYQIDSLELMGIWFARQGDLYAPVHLNQAPVRSVEVAPAPVQPSVPVQVIAQPPIQEVVVVSEAAASPSPYNSDSDSVSEGGTKKKKVVKAGKEVKDKKLCPFVYSRGDKKGQTCGCSIRNPENALCAKHILAADVKPKKPKEPLEGGGAATEKPAGSTLLRKNKAINKLWHEDTAMVFESIFNRVVIGKCVNDQIVPLTEEDIEVCKQNGFKFKIGEPKTEKKSEKKTDEKPVKAAKKEVKKTDNIIDEVEGMLKGLTMSPKKKAKAPPAPVVMSKDDESDEDEDLSDYGSDSGSESDSDMSLMSGEEDCSDLEEEE
jgi:hypothetical protein